MSCERRVFTCGIVGEWEAAGLLTSATRIDWRTERKISPCFILIARGIASLQLPFLRYSVKSAAKAKSSADLDCSSTTLFPAKSGLRKAGGLTSTTVSHILTIAARPACTPFSTPRLQPPPGACDDSESTTYPPSEKDPRTHVGHVMSDVSSIGIE